MEMSREGGGPGSGAGVLPLQPGNARRWANVWVQLLFRRNKAKTKATKPISNGGAQWFQAIEYLYLKGFINTHPGTGNRRWHDKHFEWFIETLYHFHCTPMLTCVYICLYVCLFGMWFKCVCILSVDVHWLCMLYLVQVPLIHLHSCLSLSLSPEQFDKLFGNTIHEVCHR